MKNMDIENSIRYGSAVSQDSSIPNTLVLAIANELDKLMFKENDSNNTQTEQILCEILKDPTFMKEINIYDTSQLQQESKQEAFLKKIVETIKKIQAPITADQLIKNALLAACNDVLDPNPNLGKDQMDDEWYITGVATLVDQKGTFFSPTKTKLNSQQQDPKGNSEDTDDEALQQALLESLTM